MNKANKIYLDRLRKPFNPRYVSKRSFASEPSDVVIVPNSDPHITITYNMQWNGHIPNPPNWNNP